MHILEEWRINAIEQKVDRATDRLYEINTLDSKLDSLERTVRELSSVVDGIRYELQENQNQISYLQSSLDGQS